MTIELAETVPLIAAGYCPIGMLFAVALNDIKRI